MNDDKKVEETIEQEEVETKEDLLKEYTQEELEGFGWQGIRSLCNKLGIEYTNKADGIQEILAKTTAHVIVVFKKNYMKYRRNNAYRVTTTQSNYFKQIGVIK